MTQPPERTNNPQIGWARADDIVRDAIMNTRHNCGRTIMVGLSGPQGCGKSTMTARLVERLKADGIAVLGLALDDFYLTRAERRRLSEMHALLVTRGVPGTHDIDLLSETVSRLLSAGDSSCTSLPMFDKAIDDRLARDRWRRHTGRVDIILLEGWCIGARPQSGAALVTPINALEREEDQEARWRTYANDRLAGDYARLFARLDLTVMLQAPSFGCVHRWRREQEDGLSRHGPNAPTPMTDAQLSRFIAHYERITGQMLLDEPCDLVVELNDTRIPVTWREAAQRSAVGCQRAGPPPMGVAP